MLMHRSRLSFEDRREIKVSRHYITANGTEITEEMINTWCEAYEKGELPEGDYFHGPVVYGMPPHSNEKSSVLQVVIPEGMKKDIEKRAQSEGISINSFVLGRLMDGLLAREA